MTEPPSGAWTPPPASPPPASPPPAPPASQWGTPPGGPHPPGRSNPLAVISLVFGIIQFVLCPIIGGVVAIVTGHVARGRVKNSQGAEGGAGMAMAGLILGYVGIALTIIAIAGAVLFFDDFERLILREEAKEFVNEAQTEAQIMSAPVRDPSVLREAYRTVDLDDSYQSMTLPDGTPIPIADVSDWERTRWRVEMSSSIFGDTYICVEIPESTNADPRITNGRCDVSAAS